MFSLRPLDSFLERQKARNLLVAIGIEDYPDSRIPPVVNALNDMNGVIDLLKKDYGYEIIQEMVLKNSAATKTAIERLFKDLRETNSTRPQDRVFIFIAGHGWTDEQTGSGYLVPYDAVILDNQQPDQETCVSWNFVRDACAGMPANQVFLAVDACFSGTLFDEKFPDDQSSRKACQVLVASSSTQFAHSEGGRAEQGREHSPFTGALLKGLMGYANRDEDKAIITGWDLIYYVEEQVRSATRDSAVHQRPIGNWLCRPGIAVGDVSFDFIPSIKRLPTRVLDDLESNDEDRILAAVDELGPGQMDDSELRRLKVEKLLETLGKYCTSLEIAKKIGGEISWHFKGSGAVLLEGILPDVIRRLIEFLGKSTYSAVGAVCAFEAVPFRTPEVTTALLKIFESKPQDEEELALHEEAAKIAKIHAYGNQERSFFDQIVQILERSRQLYNALTPIPPDPQFNAFVSELSDYVDRGINHEAIPSSMISPGAGRLIEGANNIFRQLYIAKTLLEILDKAKTEDRVELLAQVLGDQLNVLDWLRVKVLSSLLLIIDDCDISTLVKILLSFEKVARSTQEECKRLGLQYLIDLQKYYLECVGEDVRTLGGLMDFYYLNIDCKGTRSGRGVAEKLLEVCANESKPGSFNNNQAMAAQGLRSLVSGMVITISWMPFSSHEDDPSYDYRIPSLRDDVANLLNWLLGSVQNILETNWDETIKNDLSEVEVKCQDGLALLYGATP